MPHLVKEGIIEMRKTIRCVCLPLVFCFFLPGLLSAEPKILQPGESVTAGAAELYVLETAEYTNLQDKLDICRQIVDNDADIADLCVKYKQEVEKLKAQYEAQISKYEKLVKETDGKMALLNKEITLLKQLDDEQAALVGIYKEGYTHYSDKWEKTYAQLRWGIPLAIAGGLAFGFFIGYVVYPHN